MAPKTPAERMREYRKRRATIDPLPIIVPKVENHQNIHGELEEDNISVAPDCIIGDTPSYHIELPVMDATPDECFSRTYSVPEHKAATTSLKKSSSKVNMHSQLRASSSNLVQGGIFSTGSPLMKGTSRGGTHIYLWKDVYIFTLLDVISDHQELLLDKTAKKKKIWGSIAASLNNICGTYFTSEQANVKYRTLLIRYKKYINCVQHKGAKSMQRPKFYDEMDRLKLVSQSLTTSSTVEVDRVEESGSHSETTMNGDRGVTPLKRTVGSEEAGATVSRVPSTCTKPARPQLSSADTSTQRTAPSVSSLNATSRIVTDQRGVHIQPTIKIRDFGETTMNGDGGVTPLKRTVGSEEAGATASRVPSTCTKPARPQLSSADTSTQRTAPSVSSLNATSRIVTDQEEPIEDEDPFREFMDLLEDGECRVNNNRGKRRHHTSFKSLVHTYMTRHIEELDEQRRFRERQQQTLESINKSILALVGQLRNQGQQRNRILDALVQNRRGNGQ